jgi:hypothetical protein
MPLVEPVISATFPTNARADVAVCDLTGIFMAQTLRWRLSAS